MDRLSVNRALARFLAGRTYDSSHSAVVSCAIAPRRVYEIRAYRVLLRLCILASLTPVFAMLADAGEWTTVSLPSRPMNITENNGAFWVCGANELVASSEDGGKTWDVKHSAP